MEFRLPFSRTVSFGVLCFTVNYETNNPFDFYQQSFHGGIDPLQGLSYTGQHNTLPFEVLSMSEGTEFAHNFFAPSQNRGKFC
jgi:hypothetical protein